jgi:hypothetical protein
VYAPEGATVVREGSGREVARRPDDLTVRGGGARSTRTTTFDGQVYSWADMPPATRRAAAHRAPVVAERAHIDAGHYQVAGGFVQVLRAWRMHHDLLVVAVAERAVVPDGGDVRAVGPWRQVSLVRHEADAPIRRRVGWVPPGPVSGATPGGGAGAGPVLSVGPAAASAASTWPYLPAVVRESATRAVPFPVDWFGTLVQRRSSTGVPLDQELLVLRRDDTRAIAVRAHRGPVQARTAEEVVHALARADWFVEQFDLTLRAPRRLEATREETRWP